MTTLKIKENEYKIQFGYNCFCDTDLLDRVNDLAKIINGKAENDADVTSMGRIKDLFCIVRELMFVGFQKHNPVEDIREIGNLLDDYKEEATEENKHGLLDLFGLLSEELVSEGFLEDLMNNQEEPKVIPQDHLKKQKK